MCGSSLPELDPIEIAGESDLRLAPVLFRLSGTLSDPLDSLIASASSKFREPKYEARG